MLSWFNHKLESRWPGKIFNNHRYADDTTLMEESEEELKSLLMKVKEESEKAGLKFNIQKQRSWYLVPSLHGKCVGKKKWKQWKTNFSSSKITLHGDCSHEIKRHLLLGRKALTNLNSILRSRDITFPTKVLLVKAVGFPVFRYGFEFWTIKKSEWWRINTFELWWWSKLLTVP